MTDEEKARLDAAGKELGEIIERHRDAWEELLRWWDKHQLSQLLIRWKGGN